MTLNELDADLVELVNSAIAIRKRGWGSVEGVITAHKITMVNERITKKI